MTTKFDASNETGTILVKLLEAQLGLTGQNRVVNYNQKWSIPEGTGVYVVVRFLWDKAFGCRKDYSGDTGLAERQALNVREVYQIEVLSRDISARQRKHEVIFAFNSTQAQQVQEENSMKFSNLPTNFRDTSYVDASAVIYRYVIEMSVLRAYERTLSTDYFDQPGIPPEIHTNP